MEILIGSGNFTICVLVRFDFAPHPIMRRAITLAAKTRYAPHGSLGTGGICVSLSATLLVFTCNYRFGTKIHVTLDLDIIAAITSIWSGGLIAVAVSSDIAAGSIPDGIVRFAVVICLKPTSTAEFWTLTIFACASRFGLPLFFFFLFSVSFLLPAELFDIYYY